MYRPWLICTLEKLIHWDYHLQKNVSSQHYTVLFSFTFNMWNSIWPSLIETGELKIKISPWTSVGDIFCLSWFLTKSTYAKSSHVANLSWLQAINTKKVLLKLFKSTTRIHQIFHTPSRRNCYYEYYPVCHSQMMLTFIPFFS